MGALICIQVRKDIFAQTHDEEECGAHINNGDKAFTLENNIFSLMVKQQKPNILPKS